MSSQMICSFEAVGRLSSAADLNSADKILFRDTQLPLKCVVNVLLCRYGFTGNERLGVDKVFQLSMHL